MNEKINGAIKDTLKQIKPGTTLLDLVTYSRKNLLPINRDIVGLAQEIRDEWKNHKHIGIKEVLSMMKKSLTHEIPRRKISKDGLEFEVTSVLHPDETVPKSVELDMKKKTLELIQKDVKTGKTIFLEERFLEAFGLPKGNFVDLKDISIFLNDPEFQRRVVNFIQSNDYKQMAVKSGATMILGPPSQDSSRSIKLLWELQMEAAGNILYNQENLRLRTTTLDFNNFKDLQIRYLSLKTSQQKTASDFFALSSIKKSLSLPEPLNMEIAYLLGIPKGEPISSFRHMGIDRSFIQAKWARSLLTASGKKQASLYVGNGHTDQVEWFLQHPEYNIRTSLIKTQAKLKNLLR